MHQYEWDATPITGASARILRGFSRVGIGAAVLIGLLGLAVTADLAARFPATASVANLLGITGAVSLVVFGFFRLVGWVVAGFARD